MGLAAVVEAALEDGVGSETDAEAPRDELLHDDNAHDEEAAQRELDDASDDGSAPSDASEGVAFGLRARARRW